MAAGLGFKTFNTGDVLTAADTNGYLMQGVLVFADAAARTAAITSPQEGQYSYLKDSDTTWYYSGSAWVAAGGLPSQTGNSGKYLTTDGTSPSWATVAAGGMTQLATGTLSGSAVNLTSISGSYKHLQLVIRNYDPVTDAASILLRINNNTGTTYFKELSLFNDNQFFGTSAIELPAQDNGTSTSLIIANFNDYANTTTWKSGNYFAVNNNNTTPTNANWQNAYFGHNQTAAITQLNIVSSGGNFSGGTYILYGVS